MRQEAKTETIKKLLDNLRMLSRACVQALKSVRDSGVGPPKSAGGLIFAAGLSALIAVLLSPKGGVLPLRMYQSGDIALEDVKAARDLTVIDPIATERRKLEAERNVPPVYDHDVTAAAEVERRISTAFASMREIYEGKTGLAKAASGSVGKVFPSLHSALIKNKEEEFQKILQIELKGLSLTTLEAREFSSDVEERLKKLLSPVLMDPIIFSKELIQQEKRISIRRAEAGSEGSEERMAGMEGIVTIQEARDNVSRLVKTKPASLSPRLREALDDIAEKLVRPTLTLNKSETETRKKAARDKAESVFTIVKKGEMIVREGERVDEATLLKLEALERARLGRGGFPQLLGLSSIVLVFILAIYAFASTTIRKFNPSFRDIVFMGCVLVIVLIMTRLMKEPSQYIIPVAAGPMLVRLILNSEIAIVFSMVTAFLSGMLMTKSLGMALYFLVGSLVGAYMLTHCTQRSRVIKAGFIVSLINIFLILCLKLMEGTLVEAEAIGDLLYGALGGILSGIIVAGLTPLVEAVFNYTTDIKLLELSNMDHPALRELILRAPGSYHHSVVVSSLAEAAAKGVHCNPLLARVSAHFHDIGKIRMPQYFVENQGRESPHDRLSPRLSSLIIGSHVKEGAEIARKHRLPGPIVDVILQHHGTSLIKFFYEKAKDKEHPDMDPVNQEDFRYPGPRPQTREAGIVMLADSVEAACRSLTDPTPAQIRGTVSKIIERIFTDGQLDECMLTLRDLHEISSIFHRVLSGIFHRRVDYPETLPGGTPIRIVPEKPSEPPKADVRLIRG